MNTQNTTPPVLKNFSKQVLFKYDESKFKKTIARLTHELINEVTIGVWAVMENGKCINLLDCDLAESEFDNVAAKATYTTYEGPRLSLEALGVA